MFIKNKILFYTAIFGDYDSLLEPLLNDESADFLCITDQNFTSSKWKVVKVKKNNVSPILRAKYYKILPHRFLDNYKYSVWVDGNFIINKKANKLSKKIFKKYVFAAFDHNYTKGDKRDCIYKEGNAVIDMAETNYKANPETVFKQIRAYRDLGCPENNGLICGGILFREHGDFKIIRIMEDWWKEISKYSVND